MSTPNPFSRAAGTPTASGTAPVSATSPSSNPFAAFTAQAAPAALPVSASAPATTTPPPASASNPFAAFNAAAAAPSATLTARHIDATSDATPALALAPPPSAALQSAPPGNPFAAFGGARPVTAATNAMTGFGAAGTTLPPSSGVEASAAPRPASQNPFASFSAAPSTAATTIIPTAAPSTPFAPFGSVSAPAATTVAAAPVTSNPFSSFGGAPTTAATTTAATASNPFASMGDSQKRVVFEQLMTDLDQGNLLVVMIKKEVLFTDVARHIHRFLPPFTVPTDGDDADAAQRSTQQGQRQGQEEQHHQGHQGPQGAFFAACENKTISAGQTQAFSTASLAFAGQPNATGGSFGGVEADAQKAGGADSLHVRCAEARRAVRNVRDRDEWGPGIDWRPWVAAHDARCFTSHLRPTLSPSVLDVMIALCEPTDVQTLTDARTAANESRPMRTSNEDHSLRVRGRNDDVWFACVTAPQVLRRHIQLFSRMPGLSTLILHGSNAEDLPAVLETVAENCPVLAYVKLLKLRTSFVLCERSRKALWSMPRINAFSVSADSKAKHEACNSTPLLNSVLALFGAAPAPAPGFVSAPPSTSFSKGSAMFSFSTTPTSRSTWAVSERNVPEKETNPPGAGAKHNSDEADTNAKRQNPRTVGDGDDVSSRDDVDVNDDESRGRAFARQLVNFHCLDLRTTQHFIDTVYARCPNLTELHCNGNMEDPVALCPVTENTTLTQVRFVRCAMDYMPSQMDHPRSEGQIHSIRFNMPRLKTLKLLTEIPILGWGVSVETRVSITPLFRLIVRTKQEHGDSNSTAQEAACLALLKKPIFIAVAGEGAELRGAGGSNVSSGEDDAVAEQPIESHAVDANINGGDGDGLFFGCPPPRHNFQALREVTLRTMQPLGAMACLAAVPTITYVTMMSCHRIGPALFALIQRFPALERVTFTQCHLNVESDDFTGFALMPHLIRLIVHGCACDGLEFSLRTLRTILRRGCEMRLNGDRLVGGERFETVEEATRVIIQEAETEKNTNEDEDDQEDDEDVEIVDGGDQHTATSLAFM